MNYDLALRLKKAGFPQKKEDTALYVEPDGKWSVKIYYDCSNDAVYLPPLSELIEACGDDFVELKYWWEDRVGEVEIHKEWRSRDRRSRFPEWSVGSTPEEAVAELWLALNTK